MTPYCLGLSAVLKDDKGALQTVPVLCRVLIAQLGIDTFVGNLLTSLWGARGVKGGSGGGGGLKASKPGQDQRPEEA